MYVWEVLSPSATQKQDRMPAASLSSPLYAPDSPAAAGLHGTWPPPPKSDRTEWSQLRNWACHEKFKIAVFQPRTPESP